MSEASTKVPSAPDPATTPLARGVDKTPEALTRAERSVIALLSLAHASVFAWAFVLPWNKFTVFCVLSAGLAACHVLMCLVVLLPTLARFQLQMWRVTSLWALLLCIWGTWAVFSSAWYLSHLYGGLGQGLSAALVAIWALLVLVTVPMAAWGLVRTQRSPLRLSLKATLGGFIAMVLLGAAAPAKSEQETETRAGEWSALVATKIVPTITSRPSIPPEAIVFSPNTAKRPTSCEVPATDTPTAFAYFRANDAQLTARCYQAPSLDALAQRIAADIAQHAVSDLVLIDRITSVRELVAQSPLLDPLMLRPGLDGACIGRKCFAPWQLIAQSAFTTHAPLSFLADLKFGLSLETLRKQLLRKSEEEGPLVAIQTQSVTITRAGEIVPLVRHRPAQVSLTPVNVQHASERYADHIVAAQQPNGQFRYTLDPFSGKTDVENFSIPRQAGTLLVLCELGADTEAVNQTVRRGLQRLAELRRTRDDMWALASEKHGKLVRLGDSALPLVAFTSCRKRMDAQFDDAIRGLSQFVLSQQQPDGSFASSYDWNKRRHVGGPEALYAPGQSLLGLTLLDALILADSEQHNSTKLGNHQVLTEAIQRGMNHVANEHWNIAMYPFFFIEENWNCLTARAALSHQRNDAYERFCIDYMRFKSRLIFDQQSDVAAEFVGGFGFGNVIPPHNTGAAGFGESMAALLSVRKARNEDTAEDERLLASVLRFLLRQQWTPQTCFGCAPHVVGSMSEHMHSPITRIDFTQHAWAAVGHGSTVLGINAQPGTAELAQ